MMWSLVVHCWFKTINHDLTRRNDGISIYHQLKYPIFGSTNGDISYIFISWDAPTDTNKYQQKFSFWMCWFTAIFHSISSENPSKVFFFHEVSWLSPCYSSWSLIFDYVFIICDLFIFDDICLVFLYYVIPKKRLPFQWIGWWENLQETFVFTMKYRAFL